MPTIAIIEYNTFFRESFFPKNIPKIGTKIIYRVVIKAIFEELEYSKANC